MVQAKLQQGARWADHWTRVSGPYVTLATMGVVDLLARMMPWFPNPAPILLMAVVYSAFSGGVLPGLLSAEITVLYTGLLLSAPGTPFVFAGDNMGRFLMMAAVAPAMVLLVGALRRRATQAIQVQARADHLEELDALKTQFLNNAAHELRTPLTPIKVQLHILKRQGLQGMSEQQVKALDLVDRNINRLNALVQDLLEVAKLQAGKLSLEREPMDLHRVVTEAAESFREPATLGGVRLDVDCEPGLTLEGDPKRLLQVMFNLLSNALKFTPDGGSVRVRCARGRGEVLVRVEDTGLGIGAKDLAKLFQPFTQVHDPALVQTPSSGLGLYICKGIVEQHGGRLWAESPGPGKGAAFCLSLPLAAPQVEARAHL